MEHSQSAQDTATPPVVSLIIRTLGKRLALLERALKSAVNQTATSAFEIIVVEDGGETLREWISTHAGQADVVYCPLPPSGRSKAGNAGLELARGEFVGFLDEDDELLPDHVATLSEALRNTPQAGAVYARAIESRVRGLLDEQGRLEEDARATVGPVPFSRAQLWLANTLPIQAVMFRRALFERLGGFDESLDYLEDWDLWIRYSAEHDFIGIEHTTSLYRIPASRRELQTRAQDHAQARTQILQKHKILSASMAFSDIQDLEQSFTRNLDNYANARFCIGRILRRLFRGH